MKPKTTILAGAFAILALAAAGTAIAADEATPASPTKQTTMCPTQQNNPMGCPMTPMNLGSMNMQAPQASPSATSPAMSGCSMMGMMGGMLSQGKSDATDGAAPAHDMSKMQH